MWISIFSFILTLNIWEFKTLLVTEIVFAEDTVVGLIVTTGCTTLGFTDGIVEGFMEATSWGFTGGTSEDFTDGVSVGLTGIPGTDFAWDEVLVLLDMISDGDVTVYGNVVIAPIGLEGIDAASPKNHERISKSYIDLQIIVCFKCIWTSLKAVPLHNSV